MTTFLGIEIAPMTLMLAVGLVTILGASVSVMAVLIDERYEREMQELTTERDNARQTLALLTALPKGHVCTEQVFYTRHWYDGSPECRRCGKPSPYKFTRIAPDSVRLVYDEAGITSALDLSAP